MNIKIKNGLFKNNKILKKIIGNSRKFLKTLR